MTIGYNDFHRRWPKSVVEHLEEDSVDLKRYRIKQVRQTILSSLPVMREWPQQALSCFDLMYHESEAVIGTMTELMNNHELPSLSVHDSIVVPVRGACLSCSVLERRYSEIAGITPCLTVRQA